MSNITRLLAAMLCALLACPPAMALAEPEIITEQYEAADGIDVTASEPDGLIQDGGSITLPDGLAPVPELDGPFAEIDAPTPESVDNDAGLTGNAASDFIVEHGVLTRYVGHGGKVTIPGNLGVKVIGQNAFNGNASLTGIVIPRGVVAIENGAFYKCVNLTGVTLPAGLKTIGDYAFAYDRRLAAVSIPDTVKSIGEGAFALCGGLRRANLPEGIRTVASLLFYNCNRLTRMTVPEAVKSIEAYAFAVCYRLECVTIYSTRIAIDDSAFDDADPEILAYKGYAAYEWALTHGLNTTEINASKDPARLSKTSITLAAGRTHTLSIRRRAGRRVTWASSNEKVATVRNGKITAKGAGSCVVTATFENGKTLTCRVKVRK